MMADKVRGLKDLMSSNKVSTLKLGLQLWFKVQPFLLYDDGVGGDLYGGDAC